MNVPLILVSTSWLFFVRNELIYECKQILYPMTRKEYELVYSALRSYRTYMLPDEEVLAEKILDDIFYPSFDSLEDSQS